MAARLQGALDATIWPRLFGDCRTSRDTTAAIRGACFEFLALERLSFRPTLLSIPVAPRILGRARRA
jgi:hypothetical protein